MKYIHYLFGTLTVATTLLASCNKKAAETSNDSNSSNDSTVVEIPIESEECEPEEEFQTTDLTYNELVGHVKSVSYFYEGSSDRHTIDYSPDGLITSIRGYNPFMTEEERDNLDESAWLEITLLKRDPKTGDIASSTSWEYYEQIQWANNRPSGTEAWYEGMHSISTYSYDEEGRLVRIDTKEEDETDESDKWEKSSVKYKYLKSDEHGNWTERMVGEVKQLRDITYYE